MKQLMKFQAQKKSLNKYTWYMETHFCRFIYKLIIMMHLFIYKITYLRYYSLLWMRVKTRSLA